MSIVTTNRPIDLADLDEQVRIAAGLDERPGLSANGDGKETIVRCDHKAVTQRILDDCIDAHVPADPQPSLEEQIVALKARVAAAEAATDDIIIGALMGEFPPF